MILVKQSSLLVEQEWQHEAELPWQRQHEHETAGIQRLIQHLNGLYKSEPALYEKDTDSEGFRWLDCKDHEQSILSFIRTGKDQEDPIVIIFNHTPEVRHDYRIGLPHPGQWQEILNTDAEQFGGSNVTNTDNLDTDFIAAHGYEQSISLLLPPLGAIFLKRVGG